MSPAVGMTADVSVPLAAIVPAVPQVEEFPITEPADGIVVDRDGFAIADADRERRLGSGIGKC